MDKKIWNKTRLDRMLVEWLLRQGYYETALELADTAGVGDLTNTEVSKLRCEMVVMVEMYLLTLI